MDASAPASAAVDSMAFSAAFGAWLDAASARPRPGVVAFSFNLYEPAFVDGVGFGVELIGAERFSATDPDWPCEEVWEPDPRGIDIPLQVSGPDWEGCLAVVTQLAAEYLATPRGAWLRTAQAVAIGFVDGDLVLLWTAEGAGGNASAGQHRMA